MRTQYETPQDKENERQVARWLEGRWSMRLWKLPKSYGVDCAAFIGTRFQSLVEIKCRQNPKFKYDTYFISLDKIRIGLNWSYLTGKPFFLVVKWTDTEPQIIKPDDYMTSPKFKITPGGRVDTKDDEDVELVAHFDPRWFEEI